MTTPAVYAEGLRTLWFLASRGVEATWDGTSVVLTPPDPVADVQALEALLRPDIEGRSYLQRARKRHAPFLQEVKAAKPPDATEREWRRAIEGLESFLFSGWADEALRLGWPEDELFRVPPLWSRVDLCGAGLAIGDRIVTEITADAISILTSSGATLRIYRKPQIDYALIYATHLKLIRGNYAGDSEEPRLRAIEAAVNAYRQNNSNCGIDDAKATVMAVIKGADRK